VVLALCGGNIDLSILDRVIGHGLAVDGRRWRFTTWVTDRPGGIAALTAVIAEAGANVQEIVHERTFAGPEVFSASVAVTVETSGPDHIAALSDRLRDRGFIVKDDRHDGGPEPADGSRS
jgi:threonine dehydratase